MQYTNVSLSSPYVVKYYGSYFKNTDLWIVMEYCGAGSVSDIIRLRNKTVSRINGGHSEKLHFCFSVRYNDHIFFVQLTEDEIATILKSTLKGLEYLHFMRKIHRDIKAGNILLNTEGHAKLADFGVAGQLTVIKKKKYNNCSFWFMDYICFMADVINDLSQMCLHIS